VPIEARGLNHFVVFRGMEGDRILLSDPGWGSRTLTVAQFEKVWINHTGFTIARANNVDGDRKMARNELAPEPTDFWTSHVERIGRFPSYASITAPPAVPDTMADTGLEWMLGGAAAVDASLTAQPSLAGDVRPASPVPMLPQPRVQRQSDNGGPRHAASRTQPEASAHSEDAHEITMLQRGREALASGNIAAARLFFEREVEDGGAEAAELLADTYDDVFLRRHNVVGMRGDRDRMLSWLQVAADRGDATAAARLATISARGAAGTGLPPRG
jgi:hypothetical protein